MNKLGAAVIGMGVGERHANFYKKFSKTNLIKIYEKNKIISAKLKKKYPKVDFVENENKIFEDQKVKLISIASYDNYHFKQVIKAINYKKHIFVEKPICLFLNELKKISKALRKNPTIKLSSNLILRGSPQFKKIKSLVNKKKLGKIYYLEADYNYGRLHKILDGWRNKIPYYSVNSGGAVHMVDQIIWMIGELPYQVKAESNKIVTRNTKFRFNDFSVALLKFKSGKIAKISSNFGCVTPHHHSLKIFGSKATISHSYKGAEYYTSRDKRKKIQIFKLNFKKNEKNEILKNFVNNILKENKKNLIKFNEIINAMLICFAIEKSSKTNKKVRIDYKNIKII